jgi:hypothetical protein
MTKFEVFDGQKDIFVLYKLCRGQKIILYLSETQTGIRLKLYCPIPYFLADQTHPTSFIPGSMYL